MLTQQRLKELLHYDPINGVFIRIKSKIPKFIGRPAGYIHKSTGYIFIKIDNRNYAAHRLAFLYVSGVMPREVDHINCDRTDFSWCNLREVNRQENCRNLPIRSTNTSGFKGVNFHKGTGLWHARLPASTPGGKRIFVGSYKSPEQADAALRAKREELHGEFCRHA